jgi:hypothetical protein
VKVEASRPQSKAHQFGKVGKIAGLIPVPSSGHYRPADAFFADGSSRLFWRQLSGLIKPENGSEI